MYHSHHLTLLILLAHGLSNASAQSSNHNFQLEKVEPVVGINDSVQSIEISPNGRIIAVGTDVGIQLFRSDNLRPISSANISRGSAVGISFSANSKIIATVGSYRHPSFWSAEDGRLLHTTSEKRWGWNIPTHPELLECISSGMNPAISKWNMVNGELMQEVETDFSHVSCLLVLPDGKHFISCGIYKNAREHRYKLELRDYATMQLVRVLQEAKNQIYTMAISPDHSGLPPFSDTQL